MFDFHEKRKIRSFMYSKVTIFVLFGVAILLSLSVYDRYEVAREMEGKLEAKQAELDALRERAAALESKVKYLDDDRGLEEELRNRFDVVREGEQTVILIDSREGNGKEKSKEVGMQQQATEPEESFLEKLKFWE